MGVEIGIWRLDGDLTRLTSSAMPNENRLEQVLAEDIDILGLDLMLLGRQVTTGFGKRIDLLALDAEGDLVVIELKRDRTPREIVAQILDYGSWIVGLGYEDVVSIHSAQDTAQAFEEAFSTRFGTSPPEIINQHHTLVIVAAELDASTERIVGYLADQYQVPVNAVFFRYFVDGDREYLARSWLIAPQEAEASIGRATTRRAKEQSWNGEDYYVAFGDDFGEDERVRTWEDGRRFGFVSGGQGLWYSRSLKQLTPGARIFVHSPKLGYVGVGTVTQSAQMVKDVRVDFEGQRIRLLDAPLLANAMDKHLDDPERCEWVVLVTWIKTLPREQAIWEQGMFANQNTACKLRNQFTIDRLTERFALDAYAPGKRLIDEDS